MPSTHLRLLRNIAKNGPVGGCWRREEKDDRTCSESTQTARTSRIYLRPKPDDRLFTLREDMTKSRDSAPNTPCGFRCYVESELAKEPVLSIARRKSYMKLVTGRCLPTVAFLWRIACVSVTAQLGRSKIGIQCVFKDDTG